MCTALGLFMYVPCEAYAATSVRHCGRCSLVAACRHTQAGSEHHLEPLQDNLMDNTRTSPTSDHQSIALTTKVAHGSWVVGCAWAAATYPSR